MADLNAASQAVLPPGVDVYVVEEAANPSTDYFVLPACRGEGRRICRCGFGELPPPAALRGAVVVFVRYLPTRWLRLIETVRDGLAALVFFMDDDVLDPHAASGMPWRYRYKLYSLAARHSRWLQRQGARLWVSTPWLARKYASWEPRVIGPVPLPAGSSPCRVFYHGSASHDAEIRWLQPVMAQVLRADERVVFEIIGGPAVYRLFRGLPRVTVVHPMKWPAYQAFMDMPGRHIGLAPIVDTPFNRARSPTKLFDITRSGAVGIYAQGEIYGSVVQHGVNGLLLPMDPDAWVRAVTELARDEAGRGRMVREARHAQGQR